jgi:MFS family permease
VNYLDRVNISVAAPSMMKSLAIDPGLFGFVLSAFTIGYATMQMPGGILADRFGARAVLVCAPVLWSIFTGLTGLVESAAALVAVRFCFGLAEGSLTAPRAEGGSRKLAAPLATSSSIPGPELLYLRRLFRCSAAIIAGYGPRKRSPTAERRR